MAVFIPEEITVHLGAPGDTSAQNVTVPFIDYIKNVASSELDTRCWYIKLNQHLDVQFDRCIYTSSAVSFA